MKSILLMDSARLSAIGAMRCPIGDSIEQGYEFKFLVLAVPNDCLLVIGPACTHIDLYAAYMTRDDPPESAVARAKDVKASEGRYRNWTVLAAGEIGPNGNITGWKSVGFNVETPERLKPTIVTAAQHLSETGMLIVR